MTRSEAAVVIDMLTGLDSGCALCVAALLQRFNLEFPGWEDELDAAWAVRNEGSWRSTVGHGEG